MLKNPSSDLRSLDLVTLPPDLQALEHGTSICPKWMPDAFLDDPTS